MKKKKVKILIEWCGKSTSFATSGGINVLHEEVVSLTL